MSVPHLRTSTRSTMYYRLTGEHGSDTMEWLGRGLANAIGWGSAPSAQAKPPKGKDAKPAEKPKGK